MPIQKRVHTFFELPEPTIQYKTIDTEFYKALGGKRKRKITTMTLEEMREKIRERKAQEAVNNPILQVDELPLDADHDFVRGDFGNMEDHAIEWHLLK